MQGVMGDYGEMQKGLAASAIFRSMKEKEPKWKRNKGKRRRE